MNLNRLLKLRRLSINYDGLNYSTGNRLILESIVERIMKEDIGNTLEKHKEEVELVNSMAKDARILLISNPCNLCLKVTDCGSDGTERLMDEASPRIIKLFQEYYFKNFVDREA